MPDREVLAPESVWDPGEQLLSQAVIVRRPGAIVYLSGQTAITAAGEVVGIGDAERQIRESFDNVRKILASAGGTLADVVKLTVYFANIGDLDTYTAILGELFPDVRPAQTVVEVSRLAFGELLVEIDATAVLPAV